MADLLQAPFDAAQATMLRQAPGPAPPPAPTVAPGFSDEELLALWSDIKAETFDARQVFLRQWLRNLYYILGRQWIEYYGATGQWRDKRMAKWIPRPVTNKCKETLTTIRAMFTSIKLGVNVRPTGGDPQAVSAASTADDLAPVLYETHDMDRVLSEFDFWLVATGNAFMHTYVDYDLKNGTLDVPSEACADCGYVGTTDKFVGARATCPECQSNTIQPAMDESGQPLVEHRPVGRPTTTALSPLELAFPNSYGRFSDVPHVVRLRWRTKRYCENHPDIKALCNEIAWSKTPNEESLQIYKSLAGHNDLGLSTSYLESASSNTQEDGIIEYEVWVKPTMTYPEGLVFRVLGDSGPRILHLEATEAIPGPLPYKDASGQPLFTFTHAPYEQVGGRIYGSGPIDLIIQKQDQLNQLDSMILLIIQRMANPVWLEPKGAEIERLTGMPGLVVKWNPLTVGGNAKPERIPGIGPDATLFEIRAQYLQDIEELAGCLLGDTGIPCLDGKDRTMRELAEQYPNGGMWVYGFDRDQQRIVPAEVLKAQMTARQKPCVRVAFKEGTHVDCTDDHPFLTWDRGYIEAKDLRPDDAIVPLNIYTQANGYRSVMQPVDRKAEPVHRMVAYSLLGLKRGQSHLDVHHMDGTTDNNMPENLEVLTRSEHLKKTPRRFGKTSAQQSASARARWAKHTTAESRRAEVSAMLDAERRYWDRLSPEDRSAHALKRWAKATPEDRASVGRKMLAGRRANHRVETVTSLGMFDVYDLTTSTHNFGTSAGVFVHNTFDIMKGAKPAGVEAFSAMQLLVERSQARFSPVFQARGNAFKDQFRFAIELEREFGPDERTKAVLSPNKAWTFQTFKKSQLEGSFTVIVEDGSAVPKTSLGMRAALDHANALGMVDMNDPDQKYEGLRLFGLTKMVPTLDANIQAALKTHQAFEAWVVDPNNIKAAQTAIQADVAKYAAQVEEITAANSQQAEGTPQPLPPAPSPLDYTPLRWRPWYDAGIFRQEFIKWVNGDVIQQLMAQNAMVGGMLEQHLADITAAAAPPMTGMVVGMPIGKPTEVLVGGGGPPAGSAKPAQGGGRAMANSNQNSKGKGGPAAQGSAG